MVDHQQLASQNIAQSAVRIWLLWVAANTVGGALGGAVIDGGGIIGAVAFGLTIGVPQWLVLRPYLPWISHWIAVTELGVLLGWSTLPLSIALGLVAGALALTVATVVATIVAPATGSSPGQLANALTTALLPILAAGGGGGFAGAALGTMQWFLLRRLPSAGRWVSASAAGGVLASAVVGLELTIRVYWRTQALLAYLRSDQAPPRPPSWDTFVWTASGLVSGGLFAALYASVTGIVLVWLLRSSPVRRPS